MPSDTCRHIQFKYKHAWAGPMPIRCHGDEISNALRQGINAANSLAGSQDLTQRPKIGRIKAHGLGWGTCSRRRNCHCYRTRVLASEAFWEAKQRSWPQSPTSHQQAPSLWLWRPSDSPKRFRRLAGSLTVFNGLS